MDRHTFNIAYDQAAHKAPNHHLLPKISGYNPLSVAYLKKILESIPIDEAPKDEDEEKPIEIDDTKLREMYGVLKDLFVARAKKSNSFHDVVTDEDRASISRSIQDLQAKIATQIRSIHYYREHGEQPLTVEQSSIIPDNDYDLRKSEEYTRQAIYRAEKKIQKLKAEGKPTGRNETFLAKSKAKYEIILRHIKEKGLQ
jgi:hypothetical protein